MASTDVFDQSLQEHVWRRQFFYNAFKALAYNGIDGDYAEFGCWGGLTFSIAYAESRRHRHRATLWAYDSFQGLPPAADERDVHPIWVEGTLSTTLAQFHELCAEKGIPSSEYHAVPGFYSQTLDRAAEDKAPRNIALAYIDCDLYSSTLSVLRFLMPRLKHGMIIAFDDYFCWTATQISGERRAMLDVFGNHERWQLLPFMQFGWHGQSFVVEDRTIMGA
ncbi:MAG: TylF/MycF family methyltransferase [Gammaproteobacteria bacterium]|nr:TylF/MycF family methyltransferase [Gammaproteobacteria bacterium]